MLDYNYFLAVPYFKEEASLKRVQPQVEAFIEAFHLENCDRKEAKKRTADGDRGAYLRF